MIKILLILIVILLLILTFAIVSIITLIAELSRKQGLVAKYERMLFQKITIDEL